MESNGLSTRPSFDGKAFYSPITFILSPTFHTAAAAGQGTMSALHINVVQSYFDCDILWQSKRTRLLCRTPNGQSYAHSYVPFGKKHAHVFQDGYKCAFTNI